MPNDTFEVPEDRIVEWRRHIHAHPELANEEQATASYVEGVLHELGVQTYRPTPTSVVGSITGAAPGKGAASCIALRADMDALPVQEETDLEFSSTVPGVMHACGHDAHTAMLLGAAAVLVRSRHLFSGTVKLLFQHAEELNPGGAKFMVEAGAMRGVDEVYGLHVVHGPLGTVSVPHGNATSSAGGFFLDIQGVGAHGSTPHLGIDPALCASQVIVALNHIVSRNMDPEGFLIVNPGFIASGKAPNTLPDSAKVGCSIRTTNPEVAQMAYRRCEEVVAGICAAYGCTYEFNWVPPYDIVYNTPELADAVIAAAAKIVGTCNANVGKAMAGSEDFSEFTKVSPGAFAFLCAGDDANGLYYQNHHPKFGIVESVLAKGAGIHVQVALDRLGAS